MYSRVVCIAIDIINADKPPASLAFLAGACEQANIEYQCISLNNVLLNAMSQTDFDKIYNELKLQVNDELEPTLLEIFNNSIKEIADFNPNCIAVSMFSFIQMPIAEIYLKLLKQHLPTVDIIAGGPGVGASVNNTKSNGKLLLEKKYIDYYCLGEGDEVLVNFLQGKKDLLGLNHCGLAYESWVPQLADLEGSYLLPSYKKIQTKNYKNLELKDKPVYSISTSRGCVRACTFCDVAKMWPKFRFRDGKSVAQEVLKHHQDVGACNFHIVDSLINGSLKSFRDFNIEMIKLKKDYPTLADFSYNGMFIIRDKKSHTEELFALMQQAGCESLAIGIETGSDRLRIDDINKKFTNADLDYHLEMCQKYKIRNAFLMFVGFPTETDEDFEQTLHMLDRYQKYLIDDTILGINHMGIYALLPDTPVYDNMEAMGIAYDYDYENLDNVSVAQLNWHNKNNPGLTIKKRIERDLALRKRAAELRYPVPYSQRYIGYIKYMDGIVLPMPD